MAVTRACCRKVVRRNLVAISLVSAKQGLSVVRYCMPTNHGHGRLELEVCDLCRCPVSACLIPVSQVRAIDCPDLAILL